MTLSLLQIAGGLGLFLFGMHALTDGLRGMAGDALRRTLAGFTRSPLSGAMTGAASTAILQSSSATTVAAVGFVSAGLLTFPQALGVIFGANLGTTMTGWLVALLGFKLKLGQVVLPLILLGALMRLFGSGHRASAGSALAGFGLIFVGIGYLQTGMAAFEGVITPQDFPDDTLQGRLLLVGFGIVITLITQSSSAGVATALTAIHTGTISFPQAAALVIGMDVGTTVTALAATIGGSVESRRTGFSHVVYNLMTATGALLLLGPFMLAWDAQIPGGLQAEPEIALVAFHSVFNGLGVLVILPFTGLFARLLYRLVPPRSFPLVEALDRQALAEPDIALTLVAGSLRGLFLELVGCVRALLDGREVEHKELEQLAEQLDIVHEYVDALHLSPEQGALWRRLIGAVHSLDHLQRLHERCDEEPERPSALRASEPAHALSLEVRAALDRIGEQVAAGEDADALAISKAIAEECERHTDPVRLAILSQVAQGDIDVPEGTRQLEGFRWLRRVANHVWRIVEHLHAPDPVAAGAIEFRRQGRR